MGSEPRGFARRQSETLPNVTTHPNTKYLASWLTVVLPFLVSFLYGRLLGPLIELPGPRGQSMAPHSFHDSSVEAMFLRNDAGLVLADLFFAKAFFNEDRHNGSPDHAPNLVARFTEQLMLFPICKAQ